MTVHVHCWHIYRFQFKHYPDPQEICCHCAETRIRPRQYKGTEQHHGPYAPKVNMEIGK